MLPRAASPSYLFIGTDDPAYFPEAYPALRLRGWTQKKLLDVVSTSCLAPKLGGWTLQNYSMLTHVKTGGKKNSTLLAMTFGSFIPNLGIWIQGSGDAGYVPSMAYFSNSWKIKTRRLKTDLTLSLILRFNLRLGGYTIWSASSSHTI